MNWYRIAKLVHFLGLISLFGSFVICSRVWARLHGTATLGDVRAWTGLLEATRGMVAGGLAMLLASGMAMTGMRWREPQPFVAIGIVATLSVWIAWGMIVAPRLRAMRTGSTEWDAHYPAPPDRAQVILDPACWATVGALNGAAMGVLIIMTLKLSWIPSAAIVLLLTAAVAAIYGTATRRRRLEVLR